MKIGFISIIVTLVCVYFHRLDLAGMMWVGFILAVINNIGEINL